jgi:hypothetical protein
MKRFLIIPVLLLFAINGYSETWSEKLVDLIAKGVEVYQNNEDKIDSVHESVKETLDEVHYKVDSTIMEIDTQQLRDDLNEKIDTAKEDCIEVLENVQDFLAQ